MDRLRIRRSEGVLMAKKIKKLDPGIKKYLSKKNIIEAVKKLYLNSVVNKSSMMEYVLQLENGFNYIFGFALLRIEDKTGKVYTLEEIKKLREEAIKERKEAEKKEE